MKGKHQHSTLTWVDRMPRWVKQSKQLLSSCSFTCIHSSLSDGTRCCYSNQQAGLITLWVNSTMSGWHGWDQEDTAPNIAPSLPPIFLPFQQSFMLFFFLSLFSPGFSREVPALREKTICWKQKGWRDEERRRKGEEGVAASLKAFLWCQSSTSSKTRVKHACKHMHLSGGLTSDSGIWHMAICARMLLMHCITPPLL